MRMAGVLACVIALSGCERPGADAAPTRAPDPPSAPSPDPTPVTAEPEAEPRQTPTPVAARREPRADGHHELRWLWAPGTERRFALVTEGLSDKTTKTWDRRVWRLEVVDAQPDGGATLRATLAEHRFEWTLPDAPREVAFDSADPSFAKNIDDPIMRSATLAHGLVLDLRVDAGAAIVELSGVERLDARLEAEAAAHPDVFGDSDDIEMARLMLGMSYNAKGFTDELEGLLRTHTLAPSPVAAGQAWTRKRTLAVPVVGPIEVAFEQVATSEDATLDGCLRYDTTSRWSDVPKGDATGISVERFVGTSKGWTCFSHGAGEVVAGGWDATFEIVVSVGGTTVVKTETLHSKLERLP